MSTEKRRRFTVLSSPELVGVRQKKPIRDAGQKEIEASQKDIALRHKYKYIDLPRIPREAHRERRIAHELGVGHSSGLRTMRPFATEPFTRDLDA